MAWKAFRDPQGKPWLGPPLAASPVPYDRLRSWNILFRLKLACFCLSVTMLQTFGGQGLWLILYLQGPSCVLSPCSILMDSLRPMDCSPPGSSVHGISQARILEWVAISFSRGSSWPRDWTRISCIGRWILYHWATWEAPSRAHAVPQNVCWLK